MKVADNQLKQEQLQKYGEKISKLRKDLIQKALAANKGPGAEEEAAPYLSKTEGLARRMHQRINGKLKEENIWKLPHQTKRQRWHSFNLDKKVALVHDVVVGKMKLADAASKYQRTKGYISKLVNKVKKKPELLREMIQKQEERQLEVQMITGTVQECLDKGIFIKSSQTVIDKAGQHLVPTIKPRRVNDVTRDMGLRYKKVKHISVQGNTERSLVLR